MRLRFTPEAALELKQVLALITERSPQGASRVRFRIKKAIDLLVEHPHSGQLTSRRGLRRIVVTPYPYLIFYDAQDDELVIISVRHAARDPSTMPGQL